MSIGRMRGLLCAVVLATVTSAARADSPFSLFGNATAVKDHGDHAFVLTSDVDSPDTSDWYGGIAYTPNTNLTFGDISTLSTDYLLIDGAGGGSPRFQINVIDTNGKEKNIFVYIGTTPNFTDSASNSWKSTGNLIGATDDRYDISQLVSGGQYSTYAEAVEALGNLQVVGIQLVVDGGWFFSDGTQSVAFDNVVINNHKLTASGYGKK